MSKPRVGIVLELQQELLMSDCDILAALRKAHIIASKLKLNDFDVWIMHELNGYESDEDIPEYRTVQGNLKAWNPYYGWVPTNIGYSGLEKMVCERKMANSISSLIDLYEKTTNGFVQMNYPGEVVKILNQMVKLPIDLQFSLFISVAYIKGILERVKDALLQWTLKLEEMGVIGENLSFTLEEKNMAKSIPQTINNYYGATNVINASIEQSNIVVGNENYVKFDYSIANESIEEIKSSIESAHIKAEDKETALELIEDINNKIEKKKKPSIIKSALIGLKDFILGVGAGTVVAVIEAKINGLF